MDKIAYEIGSFIMEILQKIGAQSFVSYASRDIVTVGYIIIAILAVTVLAAIGQAITKKS